MHDGGINLQLLIDLARLLRTEADRRARGFGMTRAQWAILNRVSQTPGLSQRELAEIIEVEPITVARLVDRLEALGLVERRAVPADRRIWRLHLREAAAPVLAQLDIQRRQIEGMVTAGIDPVLLRDASSALGRMKNNLSACRRGEAGVDDLRASA